MIISAARSQGRGVLYAVSADGRTRQRLTLDVGDVREPVWSPFPNR
jgi:TolB protein